MPSTPLAEIRYGDCEPSARWCATGYAISRSIDGAPGTCETRTAVRPCGATSGYAPHTPSTGSSASARMALVTQMIGQLRAQHNALATPTQTQRKGVTGFPAYSTDGLASVSIPASSLARNAESSKCAVRRRTWLKMSFEAKTASCRRQAYWMLCTSPCQTRG